jgi:hypothetical protein
MSTQAKGCAGVRIEFTEPAPDFWYIVALAPPISKFEPMKLKAQI